MVKVSIVFFLWQPSQSIYQMRRPREQENNKSALSWPSVMSATDFVLFWHLDFDLLGRSPGLDKHRVSSSDSRLSAWKEPGNDSLFSCWHLGSVSVRPVSGSSRSKATTQWNNKQRADTWCVPLFIHSFIVLWRVCTLAIKTILL